MSDNFITNIKIKKVRHLENLEIELSESKRKHLVLTGKNGSGKTSLLKGISDFLKIIENNDFRNLKSREESIKKFDNVINDLSHKVEKNENDLMEIRKFENLVSQNEKFIGKYTDKVTANFSRLSIPIIMDKYNKGNFILAFFQSDRLTSVTIPKNIEKVQLNDKFKIGESPSGDFIKYLIDLKTQQSFARNEGEEDVAGRIEEWFNNFENALKEIFEDRTLKLKFNYKNYDFKIIQEGREPFGFDVLSDGYSSILNIVMDLILRMEPQKGYYSDNDYRQYIYDVEGIVLIDEVETHLHIQLQKKIMPFLTKLFPKIQFIISTHSPFVLSSVDNAVIYDLENKIKVEDLSKYSYEGIVEGYFRVDQYSQEIKNEFNEYKQLVNKNELSETERARRAELRIKLKNISGELASDLKQKFEELELRRKSHND